MEQKVDPFAIAVMEQRNQAMNEAAFWRVKASEWEAKLKELEMEDESR